MVCIGIDTVSLARATGPQHVNWRDRHLLEWLLIMFGGRSIVPGSVDNRRVEHLRFLLGAWDGLGYYQWLPSAFITGKFDWMFWCHNTSYKTANQRILVGGRGSELPFYRFSDLLTWFFDYPNTCFAPTNAVWMTANTRYDYAGAGAVFSFRLARRYSTTTAALLAVITIYGGKSNLYFYATSQPLMSHVHSYFLVSLFCWCGLRIIDGPRPVHVMLFLFSGAMMTRSPIEYCRGLVPALAGLLTMPGGVRGAWQPGRPPQCFCAGFILRPDSGLAIDLLALLREIGMQIRMPSTTSISNSTGWCRAWSIQPAERLVRVQSRFSGIVIATLLVEAWRGRRPARAILLILVFTLLSYSAWWCWWLGGGLWASWVY